jgi:hypothetical protein
MTDRSTDKIADIETHRAGRQQADEPVSCRQQAADSLSRAFLGFWPGSVWLPMPFDTHIPSRDQH